MPAVEESPATLQYRRQLLAVRARLIQRLAALWPALDPERLDATFLAWATAVAQEVLDHRRTAAAVAAQYLQTERSTQGIPGVAVVLMAPEVSFGALAKSLAVTGPAFIKRAMSNGVPLPVAMEKAFGTTTAVASRHVLDGGRQTVTASARADPRAQGWRRVNGSPDCDWCAARVGRVLTDDSFGAHDHCSCSAVPVYRRQPTTSRRDATRDNEEGSRDG